ncbi:MAG: helix-turn-helix domain-containing protein [Lachnospiraceae bacterium]|nr:helix-turn-helix domain-containing protein [Lachnospiraceae bacterium]
MKHSLPANIRQYRKERGLTQEQLAEALTVTVGTVSKWENGVTEPDLQMLTEMASFFAVSLDALCGFRAEVSSAVEAAETIRAYYDAENFAEGVPYTETALKKYPHNFQVLYRAGAFYRIKQVREQKKEDAERAVALLTRAMDFLEQNEDERIGALSIRRDIANLYGSTDRTEEALKIYKSCNEDGINDVSIGALYALQPGREEEALKYLSDGFTGICAEQIACVFGMLNVYIRRAEYAEARALLEWEHRLLTGLMMKGHPSYLRRIDALILALLSWLTLLDGKEKEAQALLKKAAAEAAAFDRMPSYYSGDIRFVRKQADDRPAFHDSVQGSAVEAVGTLIRQQLSDEHSSAAERKAQKKLLRFWESLSF